MNNRRVRPVDDQPSHPAPGEIDDAGDTRFRLRLEDLVPGAAGEVVLFNDSALREVVIGAPELPEAEGVAGEHRTAEGVDVAGYRFIRFRSGLLLYHDTDTAVSIETSP